MITFKRLSSARWGALLTSIAVLFFLAITKGADAKAGADLADIQAYRRLRTTTADAYYASEDRVFSVVKALKDLAHNAKLTFSLDKQLKVNNRFEVLRVKQVKTDVFSSSEFTDWAHYVAKICKRGRLPADRAIFKTMAAHYGDDELARMLATAKRTSRDTVVYQLKEIQQKSWKESGKSADDVYAILQLDAGGQNVLNNPGLPAWLSYVKSPSTDYIEALLLKLREQYDDVTVAKMIVSSQSGVNKRISGQLEKELSTAWRKNHVTEMEVFQLLKLNDAGTTLLKNPILEIWFHYVWKMKRNDPYELLVSWFKKAGIDDAGLGKMIATAKQDDRNYWIAQTLEQRLSGK